MGFSVNVTAHFLLGVFLDWLACWINSFGNALLRLDAIQHSEDPSRSRKYMIMGFALFVVGGICDVISLGFIPLSIWASNTAVSIPFSAIAAYLLLGEVMKPVHYLSMMLITIGTVGAVFTGCQDNGNEAIESFSEAWTKPGSLVLATSILFVQMFAGRSTYKHKNLLQGFRMNRERESIQSEPINQRDEDNGNILAVMPMSSSSEGILAINGNADNVDPLDGSFSQTSSAKQIIEELYGGNISVKQNLTSIGQVIPSALLPAIQTCWTNVFMKCFIEGFSNSLAEKGVISVSSLFSLGVLLLSLPAQLVFLQWMMACHDIVIAIPVYQCLMIIITSIFGLIFYKEVPEYWLGFLISTGIACVGVLIMALRPTPNYVKSPIMQKAVFARLELQNQT